MKIKRFVAQDMRQALRMVREALGEDAVILSNKSVEGGVELTAAVAALGRAVDVVPVVTLHAIALASNQDTALIIAGTA